MPGLADVVVLETALSDDPFDATPTWTDQSAVVEAVTTSGGTGATFDRYRASTLNVQFDNTVNTIDMATWHRWKQVRLRTVDGPTVLAHGHIDDADNEIGAQSPFKFPGTLSCIDGVGLFARRELDDEPVAGGTSKAVVTALATLAGLPTPTFVGMSSVPIAARTEASGRVLEVMQDILDTESGVVVRQPQDGPLQLEVRGRYAPLVAMQEYLDNGPVCVFRGDPNPAVSTEVAVRRGSIKLRPASESYRDDITVRTTREVAFTESNVPANYPASSMARDLWTADDNWAISTADMWLTMYSQQVQVPDRVSVLCATANGALPALAVVKTLRYGDIVSLITPATGEEEFPLQVSSIGWRLTRQELAVDIGLQWPHMASVYGGIDDYAIVGTGVVGTSKVAP